MKSHIKQKEIPRMEPEGTLNCEPSVFHGDLLKLKLYRCEDPL